MAHTRDHAPEIQADPAGGGYFAQAWLVLVLALFFGAALAAVQGNLAGIIADNKRNETLEKIPALIWGRAVPPGESADVAAGQVSLAGQGRAVSYPVYQVSHNNATAGWVVKAAGPGYADRIELLVGFDPSARRITGLFVLEQKETPGLGNKIEQDQWRSQFAGQDTGAPLSVVKGRGPTAGSIDAIAGATISSRSVTAIVNRAVADLKDRLNPDNVRFTDRLAAPSTDKE